MIIVYQRKKLQTNFLPSPLLCLKRSLLEMASNWIWYENTVDCLRIERAHERIWVAHIHYLLPSDCASTCWKTRGWNSRRRNICEYLVALFIWDLLIWIFYACHYFHINPAYHFLSCVTSYVIRIKNIFCILQNEYFFWILSVYISHFISAVLLIIRNK